MDFTGCLSGTLSVCACVNPSGLQRQCLLPCHDGGGQVLVSGGGGSVSMCCPLGISEIALISWQDGSQGVSSTGVDCHGSGLGWQNKVTSD